MSEATEERSSKGNPIFSFFESVFSFVLLILLVVGIATVAIKWQRSKVEFLGEDRIRVTSATWWGMVEDVSTYRAGEKGWVREGENGEEVSVRTQPIVLDP